MAFSSSIKCCIVLAILGLITNFLTDMLTTIFIVSKTAAFIIGAVLVVLAIIFMVFAFFRNDDAKKRWLFIWIFIFGIFGGFIAMLLPVSYHKTASILNRLSLYSIVAIAISNYISQSWSFLTSLILKPIIESKQLSQVDQSLLYTVINMALSLVTSVLLSLTESTTLSDVWKKGFSFSIIGWIVAAVVCGIVGILIGRDSEIDASKYDTAAAPIAENSQYTNME